MLKKSTGGLVLPVCVCVCVRVLKITELGQINVPSKKGDFCCQMQKVLQKSEKKTGRE